MQRRFAVAIVTLFATLALVSTASADFATDSWKFGQEKLTRNDQGLLDWTYDIARIEITTSAVGTRDKPPRIGFKVLEVIRAGHFPAPSSALWLGDNVGGSADWDAHSKNGTLSEWGAVVLKGPPAGTRALVLTMFDGASTMFSSEDFFPDTPANRSTAIRFLATEPWSERLANSMLYVVPLLSIAALIMLLTRPTLAILLVAATYLGFKFYDSHIPDSANIRIDLVFLYPLLKLNGATMVVALALIAGRYWKRRSGRA